MAPTCPICGHATLALPRPHDAGYERMASVVERLEHDEITVGLDRAERATLAYVRLQMDRLDHATGCAACGWESPARGA
jgi:hypothetical protein